MKNILVIIFLLVGFIGFGQDKPENIKTKIFTVNSDTIQIDTISINSNYFKVYNLEDQEIDKEFYEVDFAKSLLFIDRNKINNQKEIKVEYQPLPEFLTKSYTAFDRNLIVPKVSDNALMYSSADKSRNKYLKPFDGLYTRGSLSRGVTVGNNQDAVVNSNFNLQIEGKLSSKVGIRASITDNEVPLQSGGYTQRLDEFDKVFIELFSKDWSLKAGDIDLINMESYFMKFQKKISGVSVSAKINHNNGETNIFGSGAMVRGRFNSYNFHGIDGNQGPYKILGPNNELFIIVVSGSERVYANGVLLKRGENFDYTIDYNTGEILFSTIYSVTSNMRFVIEYQIAENNYTRFLTFDSADFKAKKFDVGVKYYNESDSKNRPLQQDLTDEQKQILADAGDNKLKMVSPSVIPESYSENKILYKKEIINNEEIFVYSNNEEDELYQVSFSYLGNNRGDYFIATSLAAGRVYEYIPEKDGVKQGNYAPIILLVAPEKKQIFTVDANFNPGERTNISSEFALSNYDQNLYSDLDDDNNNGFASRINWQQIILDKKWKLSSDIDFEYIDKNFETVERFRNVEFSRDWNIDRIFSFDKREQLFFAGSLKYKKDSTVIIDYSYENLQLGEQYSGNRNSLKAIMNIKNNSLYADGSIMTNKELLSENIFYRWYSTFVHQFSKSWIGAKVDYENNERRDPITQNLSNLSYRFSEFEGFYGIGDSTNVFIEFGYNYRKSDSLQTSELQTVNKVNTFFLKSKLIHNNNTDLSLFVNYRNINNLNSENESVLNSRIAYRQNIFNNFLNLQTLYQVQSGTLPQQEFVYVEVEPGKGFYEWIDFNENGIQELDEFVIAQFQDQAKFVRVLLPTVRFIKTNQNKFSQSVNLNAIQWKNKNGIKKVISHFSDQAYLLINSKTKRENGKFNLIPIVKDDDNLLDLDLVYKNSLFFNRGIQKYSAIYSYINSRKKSIFVFGDQDVQLKTHQFQFLHKIGNFWLIDVNSGLSESRSKSISYSNRNYNLNIINLHPKISYLYSNNSRLEVFYNFKNKENEMKDFETLKMHVFGANYQYANKGKFSINANVNLYFNEFTGNTNSPVAFQMLEGLQPGTNFTWLLFLQKRLTSFLDLNINYSGRKSETTKTIHTGSIQLRATF